MRKITLPLRLRQTLESNRVALSPSHIPRVMKKATKKAQESVQYVEIAPRRYRLVAMIIMACSPSKVVLC